MAGREGVPYFVGYLMGSSYKDSDPIYFEALTPLESESSLFRLWVRKEAEVDYELGLENGFSHFCPYSFG